MSSAAGGNEPAVEVILPRFDTASGAADDMRRGVPIRRTGTPRRISSAAPEAVSKRGMITSTAGSLPPAADDMRRGVPVRRIGQHLVTTVYDLMLAQYGV